jgi:hypothetical protein
MKKILSLALIILIYINAAACDICGCGVGNFNPYLFPHLANNFFSVSWQHHFYRTHFTENGEIMRNKEYYNTLNIAAQYSPFKNFQLMLVLPFQMNAQYGTEGSKHLSKPGDIFLLANYKLLSKRSKNGWQHDLMVGTGIKFATGDYGFEENNDSQVANSNFQAGTGSTDLLVSGYYSLKVRRMAFSSGINYKFNGTNKNGYRFGNRLQTLTQVKYIRAFKSFTIVPSLGIQTEKMNEDKHSGEKVEDHHTGGFNTQALLGADLNKRKWALGINYSVPVQQNLADGAIKAQAGFNIHLSYSL